MLLVELDEDLRAWFGKGKKGGAGGGGWDRYNTKGERIGKCGDCKYYLRSSWVRVSRCCGVC